MLSAVRVAAVLAAGLFAAGLLAGCGEDEKDPRPGPTPSTSDTPASTSTPAVGPLVEAPMFSFHLPELWSEGRPLSSSNVTTVSGGPADGFDFTDVSVETWTLKHFDDVAKLSGDVLENFRIYAPKGKLVGVTEWAGQPAYHLAGNGSLAGHAEQFGVIWKDQHIAIRFDFASPETATGTRRKEFELSKAERQALMESVEASWQWK
jgi:hypothetical protein